MFYFTDSELDIMVMEHLGNFDVTTSWLRLENKMARIQIATSGSTVVCCTEEVMKIFAKFGLKTTLFTPSGEMLEHNIKFFEAEGLSRYIHAVLPAVQYLLEFASGIATRTRQLTEMLTEMTAETGINVMLTASSFTIPNTKKILNKALRSSGASIHTNELSDTVMITRNHLGFIGGIGNLEERLKRSKNPVTNKKIMVEVTEKEEAFRVATMDIDILQLRDFSVKDIRSVKKEVDKQKSGVKIAATGEISTSNIREYAQSGADILVSSWLVSGSPSVMQVTVNPIFDEF